VPAAQHGERACIRSEKGHPLGRTPRHRSGMTIRRTIPSRSKH
jgi:hypothetical protein